VETPGAILGDRRREHGLTQTQLARRAGTTQAAISRLERDELSPSFDTFGRVLAAMGDIFEVAVMREPGGPDAGHLADLLARTPSERLELAMSWNLLAGEIALAGRRAREDERSG
jgi:transcriptional regulator with XRE-family HTH domain